MMTQAQTKPTLANVLGNTNFRLLWIGQGTSLLGDRFWTWFPIPELER